METPLYRQLQNQLGQWVLPQDRRHLQGVAEAVAAILQSQSAVLGKWIPYLTHRGCSARAHLERLAYLLHNDDINAERFYVPLLRALLQGFEETAVTLVLDTSMLWDQCCLIEVCLAWGGRSLTLAQVVLEHGSAPVGFEDYRPVLEAAQAVLPTGCQVTFLVDRGFLSGDNYLGLFRAFGEVRKSLAISGHAAITSRFSSSSKLVPRGGNAHILISLRSWRYED